MAEQIQSIKRRMKSIGSTERITNAMKLVSASKLRKAKAVYEHSQGYLSRILESIEDVFDAQSKIPKEYLIGTREIKNSCYIVITSSSGLCGSFNGNILRKVDETVAGACNNTKLVTIGSKGREHFENLCYEIIDKHDPPADTMDYDSVIEMAEPLMKKYLNGEIDEIILVYTAYINSLKQEVIEKRIFPIDIKSRDCKVSNNVSDAEFDPSVEEVFEYLMYKFLEMNIYSAVIESATCEHAARREAMESANESAEKMLTSLKIRYNHARQAQITDEIIEIVSGAEAQNG